MMLNGVFPTSLSAFNVPDSRLQVLANNVELANASRLAGIIGNNATTTVLSNALLLHQLINTALFPTISGFPSSLLSPGVTQFFFIRNLTINQFNGAIQASSTLTARITANNVFARISSGAGVGQGVPTVDFFV